jgi:hypothetical protein
VSLASVKSFTSGSLAADSWSELLSKGFENDGLGGLGPAIQECLGEWRPQRLDGWCSYNVEKYIKNQ